MENKRDPQWIKDACIECANQIHTGNFPSVEYQTRVTRLLFATIAHESGGFQYRRQLGFAVDTTRGAFGLSQMEIMSISECLNSVFRYPGLVQRFNQFTDNVIDINNYFIGSVLRILQTPEGDKLSIALCRLHYIKFRELIPGKLEDAGLYAKKYYNTHRGKAKPQDYTEAFNNYWPD